MQGGVCGGRWKVGCDEGWLYGACNKAVILKEGFTFLVSFEVDVLVGICE